MCGIAGIVHRAGGAPVSPDRVRIMCDAMRHRGPDDEGLFVEGAVGLGMRRLSIIDLAGGHQPIFNEDRSKVIVFNGEIYNYREHRARLVAAGHRFRTNSDTETILHLYEELGERCVEPLRGMFAFAIWDATTRTLLLARDRFGIKPLYVVLAPWGVAFASELKALLAVGASAGTLDWNALDMYFELGYIPAPASPFTDVRKLEPGEILLWQDTGRIATHHYWDLPHETCQVPSDLEDRVLHWFDNSVAAHLVSDVPVAAFLSGGLDSSAVVASMAVQGDPPHAFTARYHGSGAATVDESGLAVQLTQRYGARLTVIDVEPDVRAIFEPIIRALDEPHADASAIPTWLISAAVAQHYKVALAGTGGDELFAGYRRHIGLLLAEYYAQLPAGLRRAASTLAQTIPEPRGAGLQVNRLKRFFRAEGASAPERFLSLFTQLPNGTRRSLYQPALGAAITGSAARDHFASLYGRGGEPHGLRAGLYLDYKSYLPDDILALSDRLAMAHSLEVRVPFVDHQLVEQVYPLPDRLKIRQWQNKHLLRRVLRSRLPAAHLRAPKRGFVGPTAAWLRNELRELVTDELAAERLGRLGYFDCATVTRLLEEHFSRRQNREGILWALLCFSTWHRLYLEQSRAPAYRPS
jgi:asparagine synthase (glutamine-hydrolysing)